MKKPKLGTLLIILSLMFTFIFVAKAQLPAENVKTFFNSQVPGINIQVNATVETQPTENITVILSLTKQTNVYIEYFDLSIFGFLNGTDKIMMANITESNFSLNDTPKEYNCTFPVPEQAWDVTYGEILLTYRADVGGLELRFPQIVCGFTMTQVENVYLKDVEEQLGNLNETYNQLQQNYTALQKSLDELNGTRQAAVALAITTVFFVATTLFFVMRKPKQYW